jgi:hypothetical protein
MCLSLVLQAQKSIYTMPFENNIRLPAMKSAVNMEEITATYQTMGNIYTTEIIGFGEESMEQTSTTHISDVKVVDAIRFLEYYMEDQLLDPSSGSQGQLEMSVIYFNEDTRWNIGSVVGVLTFGIATLMGVPYATAVADVELKAVFYSPGQESCASQRGTGRGKCLQTLYSSSGFRKAHQRALKKAIQDLNDHILLDPLFTGIAQEATL